MFPTDVATARTLAFVLDHLPRGGAVPPRLLEVGCGTGALARALGKQGCVVVALDESTDAVREAVELGVDARVASWPDVHLSTRFDVVLFSRSLHHIRPLDAALDRACEVLVPGGRVVVEDFAFADADRATVRWFAGALAQLEAAGAIARVPGALGTRLLECEDALEAWHHEDSHGITTASVMRAALAARLTLAFEGAAPYLYRYLLPLVRPNAEGAAIVERFAREESELARTGVIACIGRRWVGCPAASAAPRTRA